MRKYFEVFVLKYVRAFILVFMADNDMWQSTNGNTGRAGSNRGGNVGAPIYGSGATRNAEGTSGTTPVSYTHLRAHET